jgi:hypothetical protein
MSLVLVAAALLLQGGNTSVPSAGSIDTSPPIVQTARFDPSDALRKRGFSDPAIALVVKAAEAQAQSRVRQAQWMAALKLQLKVVTSAASPVPDRITALLREAVALTSKEADDRVNRTSTLLAALPPSDLKLYLATFGPDEPNLMTLALRTPVR